MSDPAVVIVGAGPTGMMLGAELTLAGVNVMVVERRTNSELEGSRSGGLHSRTIEVLDQRGIAERFLAEGKTAQVQSYAMTPLDISDFPTRHNYGLALWQKDFERIFAGWIGELGVPVRRGHEVTGFQQTDAGVDVQLSDDRTIHTDFLVGCDGGRSEIRKTAGVDFPGWDPTHSMIVAEAEMGEEPPWGLRRDKLGQHGIGKLEGENRARVVVCEGNGVQSGEATLDDLRRALIAVWGTDFAVKNPTWISRFTDMARQADAYRNGRVLLAGDAAHVHYPIGGQGLNLGIQDAVNLGWKLAQVVKGISPPILLDTYQEERHPVGARVLKHTMAQTALTRGEPRIDALRDSLSELLDMDEPRKRFAAMMSGLDIHYELSGGHPLVGRRMPDLDLHTPDGDTRVFAMLHDARPLLINFGTSCSDVLSPWSARVRQIEAVYDGKWELPALGEVAPPRAVLVRPDGYVAWTADLDDSTLPQALTTWFGPADAS